MDILTQKQTAILQTKLGEIQVQTPSLSKKLDIQRRRSLYVAGLAVISQDGAELADMFATLDVIMTKSPIKKIEQTGSWDYDSVYDEEALHDAYIKAVEWLDSFRKRMEPEQA